MAWSRGDGGAGVGADVEILNWPDDHSGYLATSRSEKAERDSSVRTHPPAIPGWGEDPLTQTRALHHKHRGCAPTCLCPSAVDSPFTFPDERLAHVHALAGVLDRLAPKHQPQRQSKQKPRLRGAFPKPTPGLEPGTPSLRVKCSTS
jgi:hypothetical protein